MRFFRRKRRSDAPVDELLGVVTSNLEDLAQQLFEFVLLSGQTMPSRLLIDKAIRETMIKSLEPARAAAIAAGKSEREVEAYASVVTSHAQVAFQTKWAELSQATVISTAENLN